VELARPDSCATRAIAHLAYALVVQSRCLLRLQRWAGAAAETQTNDYVAQRAPRRTARPFKCGRPKPIRTTGLVCLDFGDRVGTCALDEGSDARCRVRAGSGTAAAHAQHCDAHADRVSPPRPLTTTNARSATNARPRDERTAPRRTRRSPRTHGPRRTRRSPRTHGPATNAPPATKRGPRRTRGPRRATRDERAARDEAWPATNTRPARALTAQRRTRGPAV
jgi:hypothetical protein